MNIDDSRPIWIQLVGEFRRRIAVGEWPPGSKLPSVRELALDLSVNPNTVQRALGEIDRDGLTSTERTTGRFVAADEQAVTNIRQELGLEAADEFLQVAIGVGLNLTETQDLIAARWHAAEANDEERTTK